MLATGLSSTFLYYISLTFVQMMLCTFYVSSLRESNDKKEKVLKKLHKHP